MANILVNPTQLCIVAYLGKYGKTELASIAADFYELPDNVRLYMDHLIRTGFVEQSVDGDRTLYSLTDKVTHNFRA